MGISIEIARQKLHSSYGIDVDKYTNDESVDLFEKKLDSILSCGTTSVLPVVISGTAALLLSVGLSFQFDSALFGVLFFLFSIPVFLIGIGAVSVAKATENLLEGISFIMAFTSNITKDIRNGIEEKGKFSTNPKDFSLLMSYAIIFPIVKKIMRKKPLGDILYFVIEKIVNKGLSKIEIENNNTNDNKIDLSNSNNKNRLFTVSERVKNASKSALKSIIAILKIIGIAVIILGTILLLILFLIFYITK